MTRKEIRISPAHFQRLAKDFDVSRITIYNALKYVTNSDLAQNIRTKAKEMLLDEANKVQISVEFDKNV